WLWSAGIVAGVRLLHAAEIKYDLTVQIQAAQNLLLGKGLTTYGATSTNLADPLTLVPLTSFPAGYSLCAAALMAAGATPALVMKILGAAATMLGWWGWAVVAFGFVGGASRIDRRLRALAYLMGATIPLLYTQPWGGTDIFLWASVPWVLRWLTRSTGS